MTSNLGNEVIHDSTIGFADGSEPSAVNERLGAELKDKIDQILRQHFKLEFLNRVDEIVIFKSLTKEDLMLIIDLELDKVEQRLKNKDIRLKIAQRVKTFLAEAGYDRTFGARPLKRKIQELILDELALEMIEGKIKDGDKVAITLNASDKILLSVTQNT